MIRKQCFFFLSLIFLFTHVTQAGVRVLMFHAHENLGYTEEAFREQMDFLAENDFHTITPDQLLNWVENNHPLPIRPLLITVDDSYLKVYTSMFPILYERNQIAVNFMPSSLMGGAHDHCSWEQIRVMEDIGNILTESHTKTHPHLTQISYSEATREIEGSKIAIEANMPGKECLFFAYPYGDFDQEIISKCRDAGYRAAFTVIPGEVTHDSKPFRLPRYGVSDDDLEEFKGKIGFDQLPPSPPGDGWIIDNTDPNFFSDAGWNSRSNIPEFFHTDCMVHFPDINETEARWAAYLPKQGLYRVHAWWPEKS